MVRAAEIVTKRHPNKLAEELFASLCIPIGSLSGPYRVPIFFLYLQTVDLHAW